MYELDELLIQVMLNEANTAASTRTYPAFHFKGNKPVKYMEPHKVAGVEFNKESGGNTYGEWSKHIEGVLVKAKNKQQAIKRSRKVKAEGPKMANRIAYKKKRDKLAKKTAGL